MKIFEVIDLNKDGDEDIKAFKKAAKLIAKNCQPFLAAVKGKPNKHILFRGIRGVEFGDKIMRKGKCPVGRKPRDTPKIIHKFADEWFLEKTGIRYRSNAVFCTGYEGNASTYGPVYVMLPIGPMSFCYSPLIEDLTNDLDMASSDEETRKDTRKTLKDGKYEQNTNLVSAIKSGHEIMIHCSGYYVISQDNFFEVLKYLVGK